MNPYEANTARVMQGSILLPCINANSERHQDQPANPSQYGKQP